MVAGRCPRRRCAAGGGIRPALDGGLSGAARLFHCPAAGRPQRGEPARGADGPHLGHLVRAGAGPCAGRGRQVHGRSGSNGPQRDGLGLPDASVLPAGGGVRIRCGPGPTPHGPGKAPVGDPLARGGRALPCQCAPHGGEHAGARLPDGLSAGCRGPQRRRGPVWKSEGNGPAPADLSVRAAGEPVGPADAGDHAGAYPGRDGAAFGAAGPDAPAHGLLLRAGGGGVLGVGSGGCPAVLRAGRGRGRLLSDRARPGDAADVSGKHGGRCHEGGRGAEGRVPVQPVGCRAAHRGGDGAAAPVRDERLPVRHPAVQRIYLPGQHGPSAAGQRDASGADALAGGTAAGGGRVGRGGGVSPGNAVRLAGQGDAGAAGGAVHRLLRHGAGGAGRRLAAGSGCRGAGCAPPGPGPAEGEKSVKSTRTMKSSGHRGTKRV